MADKWLLGDGVGDRVGRYRRKELQRKFGRGDKRYVYYFYCGHGFLDV